MYKATPIRIFSCLKLIACLLLGGMLLTSCKTIHLEEKRPEPFQKIESAIYKRLSLSGVRFVQLGDEVKLILPYNSWFFSIDSLFLSPQSYSLLTDISRLLNSLDYLRLTLRVYPSPGYESVAHQQAIVLADYLIHYGLNSRLVGVRTSDIVEKSPAKSRVTAEPHIELSVRLLHPEDID